MKHCKMYYAGYQHLSCDTKTHTHRLLNIESGEIEIWQACRCKIGIPYKNTTLRFLQMDWGNYGYNHNQSET